MRVFAGLDVGVAVGLGLGARVSGGAEMGGADQLGVFPDGAGVVVGFSWTPGCLAGSQFGGLFGSISEKAGAGISALAVISAS